MANDKKSILLSKTVKEMLRQKGKKGQSFDDLLREIAEHIEKCDRWWCENR